MNKFIPKTLIIILLSLPPTILSGSTYPGITADSTRFSLLTCAPGDIIYTLFGHTAIRYQNFTKQTDIVYNYGLFSFGTTNFAWLFAKGETDYALGDTTFDRFAYEYYYYNRTVWEQELNLNTAEKQTLQKLLEINNWPENRVYRYNNFFDNCATRAYQIIERSIQGAVEYSQPDYQRSFRDIIHESTVGYDWSRFGIDFCLGSEIDRLITHREEMFAPLYLMAAFADAQIRNNNQQIPLVTNTATLVHPLRSGQTGSYLITPLRAFLLLFMIVAALTIYGIRKKKSLWWLDLILFLCAGIAGCVIAFLVLFSEQPAVNPNYLIFVFHPIHLLALPFIIRKGIKARRNNYHVLNAAVLTLFILLWPIIPQHFNPAVLPLALCLLIRSASNLVLTYNPHKK